jgi:hypothetical protein
MGLLYFFVGGLRYNEKVIAWARKPCRPADGWAGEELLGRWASPAALFQ